MPLVRCEAPPVRGKGILPPNVSKLGIEINLLPACTQRTSGQGRSPMNDASERRRSIESLKKEAKRWLAELRDNDEDARTRLVQSLNSFPNNPTLRDVQHALARENGYAGWNELTAAMARDRQAGTESLAHYEAAALALLNAYRTGTPDALERHYRYTWHRRSWPAMRTYVQLDLGKGGTDPNADVDIHSTTPAVLSPSTLA